MPQQFSKTNDLLVFFPTNMWHGKWINSKYFISNTFLFYSNPLMKYSFFILSFTQNISDKERVYPTWFNMISMLSALSNCLQSAHKKTQNLHSRICKLATPCINRRLFWPFMTFLSVFFVVVIVVVILLFYHQPTFFWALNLLASKLINQWNESCYNKGKQS